MCGGGGDDAPVQEAVKPQVAATPPPAEPVAETPVTNEGSKRTQQVTSNRKGTSALRINLNMGGVQTGGGTGGLSIPQ